MCLGSGPFAVVLATAGLRLVHLAADRFIMVKSLYQSRPIRNLNEKERPGLNFLHKKFFKDDLDIDRDLFVGSAD